LLVAGLLLSALLPDGALLDLVVVRLGTAALIVLRLGESIRPWFWRSDLPRLLGLAIGVLGLCGLGFWWLEPGARTFGDGLWLAFTTAATVGYGDIVPSTPAAKIFSVFVVLMGFAVLSLVTAAIAAMWVRTEERRIEHEIQHDLHRELRQIREELAALRRDAQRRGAVG
jgi:voltage-gated potassium channel